MTEHGRFPRARDRRLHSREHLVTRFAGSVMDVLFCVRRGRSRQGVPGGMSDKTLTCRDCDQAFTFTAGEQAFYLERGFSEPQRCPACRSQRKAQRSSSGGGGGGYDSGGYGGGGYSSGSYGGGGGSYSGGGGGGGGGYSS